MVFSIGETPEKIDFTTRINLVKYAEADKKKIMAVNEGIVIADIDALQLIQKKETKSIID